MHYDPNEWQGRRPKQIQDSHKIATVSVIAIALVILVELINKFLG